MAPEGRYPSAQFDLNSFVSAVTRNGVQLEAVEAAYQP